MEMEGGAAMSNTPRTSEEWRRIQRLPDGRYSSQVTYEDLAHGMCNFAKQLERELAEARSMTEGQWLLKVAARLVTAGCKSDGIVDAMDELIQQRDTLAEAMIPAMARAYARGYNHGHEDTVESTFMTIHASDELTFFADDIRQMLLDGSHPEAQAALAAVKGGEL